MKGIFDMDSPMMKGLAELTDMIILNVLALVCSIPVFTIGAASAGLFMALDKVRKETGSPVRSFFEAFRENFKQATLIWLALLALCLPLVFGISFYFNNEIPGQAQLLIVQFAFFLIWSVVNAWAIPLQCRFENTVKGTLRNALLAGFSFILETVVMVVLDLVPVVLFLFYPPVFLQLGLVWLFFWWSVSTRIKLKLLDKPTARLAEGE